MIELAHNPEMTEAQHAGLAGKGKSMNEEEEKMNQVFLNAQKEFSDANHLKLEKANSEIAINAVMLRKLGRN